MRPAPASLLLVVNPASGGRRGAAIGARAAAALRAGGVDVELRTTERPGHGRELTRALAGGRDGVLAVGGDGTLFEVLNGLTDLAPRPALGVVPAGSGNSLALDLGLAGPEDAVARVLAGARRTVDTMAVERDGVRERTLNMVGWGAAARINARAERLRFAVGWRYDLAALVEVLRPRLAGAGARLDGEDGGRVLLGIATVTRHAGRGMCVAPDARLDDGLLDLVTIDHGGRLALLGLLARVHRGAHVGSPLVRYEQRTAFTLELEPGGAVVLDGEWTPARRVRVEVAPGDQDLLA